VTERLADKVALITGAASGIGAATALRFAQEGAVLAGIDLHEPKGGDWEQATKLVSSCFEIADVRDESRLAEVIGAAREQLGRIDILVNSAGVGGGGPVHAVDADDWDFVLDINLKGTFLASKHVLPGMLEQGHGSIVNIASVEGIEGFAGGSSYNASKGGVITLTKNMAIDYARKGVRVNAVCPGFIDTPLLRGIFSMEQVAHIREEVREAHQLGRFGEPVEIANACLFLASEEASFVTGVALPVDGGYTAGHRFSTTKLMGLE
jgi:NAD(P)-dependent dehydrogenase (short-subunit alcohol dehydrogenase family)